MMTYDFTFVVDADPYAENFEDRFIEAGCDDATFVLRHGAAALCFDRTAGSYKEAVLSAYQDIRAAGASILRFEPDFLVTSSEIADRSGLSRQAISLFDKGERRDSFPRPLAKFGAKSPLWDWVEVSRWLWQKGHLGEEVYHQAMVSRVVNLTVQLEREDIPCLPSVEEALTA